MKEESKIQNIYQLTPMQEGMLFHSIYEENGSQYFSYLSYRLHGKLIIDTVREAINEIVKRHEVLRSAFVYQNVKTPVQVVLRDREAAFVYKDFRRVLRTSVQAEVDKVKRDDIERSFDLEKDPLMRITIIEINDDEYEFIWSHHHILMDGWCTEILIREFQSIYRSLINHLPITLPPVVPFGKYSQWLALQDKRKAKSYWDNYLKDFELASTLPKISNAAISSFHKKKSVRFGLNDEQTQKLNYFAARHGLTFNSIVRTLWGFILSKYNDTADVVFGAVVSGRPSSIAGVESIVGLFINTLPVRVNCKENEKFVDLARKVQADYLESEEFQFYPLADIQAATFLKNSLIDHLLVFENFPLSEQIQDGNESSGANETLRISGIESFESNNYPLNVFIFTGSTLRWELCFDDQIFQEATIRCVGEMLNSMLLQLIENHTILLNQFEVLSAQQREVQLEIFNNTTRIGNPNFTIHGEFERYARDKKDAVFITSENKQLSFDQINAWANRVARLLKNRECQRVGLLLDCSMEAVVSMLAAVKAGLPYVPIDPDYPKERKNFIINDSGIDILLTRKPILFSDRRNLDINEDKIVCVDHHKTMEAFDASNLTLARRSSDTCYLIYTSGSTGNPKGVMISYESVGNYLQWANEYYVRGEEIDFPFFTSPAFDLTVTSVLLPLVSGNRIHVYKDDHQGLAIEKIWQQNKCGIVKLTPSHLKLLELSRFTTTAVKRIIVGGEIFETELAKRVDTAFDKRVEIFNEYGPTEATVGCMIYRYVDKDNVLASVPIGNPIANSKIYILDKNLNPLPIGAIGTLYIGGAGLAQAYWNREELTRKRFMASPFVDGEILYMTGDTARFIDPKRIEYVGRIDHQVKILGHRVELGEIENSLTSHRAVHQCVVTYEDHASQPTELRFCKQCGLPSNYPDTYFNTSGICNQCTDFESYKEKAYQYFKTPEDLKQLFSVRNPSARYDCLMLLSGGKDSTYVLCQLVRELKLRVLVFSMDNGFISEGAKENIRKVTTELGVDLIFGSTQEMNKIFVDSLTRYSNVCNGCFKTIYSLSMNLAKEKNIPYIVTGLSRGQIFETRLHELFNGRVFDVAEIDSLVLDSRKTYHRMRDAVSTVLDPAILENDDFFEKHQFVDYFRYSDVTLEEIYNYLGKHIPWVRPDDTGRSTNCLINEAGIHVHKKERGYHNYALPYAWDVRIGHKTREEALAELDDKIDVSNVKRMLKKIGYEEERMARRHEKRLTAYLVVRSDVTLTGLRSHLASLPHYMIPADYYLVDAIPLTTNGKVDRRALKSMQKSTLASTPSMALSETEKNVSQIFKDLLRIDAINPDDSFFEIGGHSLTATRLLARIQKAFNVRFKLKDIFENPSVRQLAKALDQAPNLVYQEVPAAPAQKDYAVSYAQKRLWLLNQFEENRAAYNVHLAYKLSGLLKPDALRRALDKVVERHEILRTTFRFDGVLNVRQVITAPEQWENYFSTTDLPVSDGELKSMALQHANTSFDMANGPLFKVTLVPTGNTEHVLLITMHHILIDDWSMQIMIKELSDNYNAICRGHGISKAPLSIQYKDYAEWQRSELSENKLVAHERFWVDQFSDEIPVLNFPTDKIRPLIKTSKGGSMEFRLGASNRKRLESVSKDNEATLFMTLLTSVGVLLSHYSNQEDVVVGTSVSNRQGIELDDQIGFYINMLPLRVRPVGELSFTELLNEVRLTVLGALHHQAYPFDKLIEKLKVKRDTGRTPLFDVVVELLNSEVVEETIKLDGLSIDSFHTNFQSSKYDLTFTFRQVPDDILLIVEYSLDLFTPEFIAELFEHYQVLLDAISADLSKPLALLELTTEKDLDFFEEVNQTAISFPGNDLVSLFREQVRRQPHHPAIRINGRSMTYQELNQQSDCLANELLRRDVIRFNRRVAILLERSEKTAIAIWAILKSGCAFVPLESSIPSKRKEYILHDAKAQLLITEMSFIQEVSGFYSGEVIAMDVEMESWNDHSQPQYQPSEDAYVLYTSGSTGVPKGIEITLPGLFNYVQWANSFYFKNAAGYNFAFFTSLTFDLTITSFFTTFTRGDTLLIIEQAPAAELVEKIFSEGLAAVVKMTPSHVALLANSEFRSAVEIVILGGEPLTSKTIEILTKINPAIKIYNEYGPTEITVACSAQLVDRNLLNSVGRPISNTRIYILDDNLRRLPRQSIGEICVSGPGLATGYFSNPELTQQKFVLNPFEPNTRLYKTGDFGRWTKDGNIFYVGRNDSEIKLDGNRINLDEIEQVLLASNVISNVAVLCPTTEERKDLVVFYSALEEHPVDVLRNLCRQHLPDYMIPSFWNYLPTLPLTPHGKIDKQALLRMDWKKTTSRQISEPENSMQAKLAEIWKSVLGLSAISIDDTFFEMGGGSLKAVEMLSLVKEKLGATLRIGQVFAKPTIRMLSMAIESNIQVSAIASPGKSTFEKVRLSMNQSKIYRQWLKSDRKEIYNSVLSFKVVGSLDVAIMEKSLNEIVARHDVLRTRIFNDGVNVFQTILNEDHSSIEVIKHYSSGKVRENVSLDAEIKSIVRNTEDIYNTPLFRVAAIEIAPAKECVLVIVLHDLICDNRSRSIFVKDLFDHYNSYVKKEQFIFSTPKVEFNPFQYILLEDQISTTNEARESQKYWDGLLRMLEAHSEQRRSKGSTHGKKITMELDTVLSDWVNQKAKTHGVGKFTVLVALLHRVLGDELGLLPNSIGIQLEMRHLPEIENQLGQYENNAILVGPVNADRDVDTLIYESQKNMLEIIRHQLYPYRKITNGWTEDNLGETFFYNITSSFSEWRAVPLLSGTEISLYTMEEVSIKSDFHFGFIEKGNRITLDVTYNSEKYKDDEANRLIEGMLEYMNVCLDVPVRRSVV